MVGSWTISSLKFTPIKPVKKESRITSIKKTKQNKMLYSFAVVFPLLVTLILIFSSFSS